MKLPVLNKPTAQIKKDKRVIKAPLQLSKSGMGPFPLGVLSVWFANMVRIAVLIAVGTSFSPERLPGSFTLRHDRIAFILMALRLVALSHRLGFFTTPKRAVYSTSEALGAAVLVPLLVLRAVTMVARACPKESLRKTPPLLYH